MTMTNIIEILQIVIWPLTVLILVLVAKSPILSLLPAIQKIRFQGAEIEFFSQSLRKIKDDISEHPQMRSEVVTPSSDIQKALGLPPAHLVLEVWNALERSARTTVERVLLPDETFKNPLERPIDYLEFKGALTPTTAIAIRDLRTLRNQIAHFGGSTIPKKDALQYADLATGIINIVDNIAELPKIKLTALTLFILEINRLIDSRKFDNITIDEVYGWIQAEDIIPSLATTADGHVDLSVYGDDGPYSTFAKFYHEQMKSMYGGYAGDHARKWGVENMGLCLLLAWTNQLIQQGSGWYPSEM